MVELIFLFTVFFLVGFYFLYYKPKKAIERFAKEAEQLGYKVKLLPFEFMRYYLVKYYFKDEGTLRVVKQDWSKYDLIVGNIFGKLAIMIGKTSLIKHALNQMNKLQKNPFISEIFQNLNDGGIAFTEGDAWKRKRKIISSVFHYDFLNDLIPVIEEEINLRYSEIDFGISRGEKQVDLRNVFTKILSNVVAKCFFGTDMKDYLVEDKPYCEYFVECLNDLGLWIGSWEHMLLRMKGFNIGLTKTSRQIKRKLRLLTKIAEEITRNEIEKIKRKEETKKNILTALYQNQLLNLDAEEDPDKYTMFQIVGEFFAFFAAGTDTTANSTNLALHYLSQNPNLIEQIRKQSSEVKSQGLKKAEQLKRLKLCEAVFNETLRVNGPASNLFTRQTLKDLTLDQLKVPRGTTLTISLIMSHYNEESFEEASQFKPQRWLGDLKLQPYAFIPFSGGERNCIGQYLARIQFKLLITKMVEKYNFKALNPIKMKQQFIYATREGSFQMELRKQIQTNSA